MARACPDGPPDEAGPDFLQTRCLCRIPSVLSLRLHRPSAVQPGSWTPCAPSPASSRTWVLRPSNRGSPFRGTGEQDARPYRDAGQALPESDVLGQGASCHCARGYLASGAYPGTLSFPLHPIPHPRQALSPVDPWGAPERGCPEPEKRMCVPGGCGPAGPGPGQGAGRAEGMTVTQSLVLTPRPRASGASKGSRLQKNLPNSTGTGREDRLSSHARRPGIRGALEPPVESRPGLSHQEPGAGGGGQSPGPQAGDPRETGRGPPPSAFGGCGRTGLWQPAPAPCSHVQRLPAPEAAPPTCSCRAALLLPLIGWHLARPGSSGPGCSQPGVVP